MPDPRGRATATRDQLHQATRFRRGEGIWYDDGTVYVATTIDSRVHAYDTRRQRIEVDIRRPGVADEPPLTLVDQMTGRPPASSSSARTAPPESTSA